MGTFKKDKMQKSSDFFGFRYAINGFLEAVKSEKNLRIHLVVTLMVISAGFFFHIKVLEWIAVFIMIGLVIMAELFNTAVETIINLVSPDFNHLAGKAKDISAAAVFITAIVSIIVGMAIFVPYCINFWENI